MAATDRKQDWPKRIPRDRAIPALDLAGLILDQEEDLEPRVEEGDNYETVTIDADRWGQWLRRARQAVGGLLRVEARPLPERPAPPDYAEALEAFLFAESGNGTHAIFQVDTRTHAFEAGWNAGRARRAHRG